MIIVGELINASRKKIAAAIESQDTEAIQTIAKDQHENGANYIDVNAGVFVGKEPEYLQWLTSTAPQPYKRP
jgi:5-methyltetrahydrofolate--homocysteine methyltransferase